jgi:hypothetical protein
MGKPDIKFECESIVIKLVAEITGSKSQKSVQVSMAYFVEGSTSTGLAIFDGRGCDFGGGGFSVWHVASGTVLNAPDFFNRASAEFYLKELVKAGIDWIGVGEKLSLSLRDANQILQSKREELTKALLKSYELDKQF